MTPKKESVVRYTVVGYDEQGHEMARRENLTEAGAVAVSKEYPVASVLEVTVIAPRVMCDLEDGRVAITRVRLPTGELKNVCRYHASGVYVVLTSEVPQPIRNKIKWKGQVIASDWLCYKYCPSQWNYECRAFLGSESFAEKRKREKGYAVGDKLYTVLCIEDLWWRRLASVEGV